jgi:predicted metalloprotease
MDLDGQRESDNVDDVRGQGSSGGDLGGSAGLLGGLIGGRHISIGGIVIALVVSYLLGINPLSLLGLVSSAPQPQAQQSTQMHPASSNEPMVKFVKTILASTEDVWSAQFQAAGSKYRAPRLEIFSGQYPTACGQGSTAQGPFYCPADEKVYIDLAFYQTLKDQLGAPGEFAQAYVIAHEVGHHVQHLLGISDKVDHQRSRATQAEQNVLSVRLELQADCLAGVWGFHAKDQFHIEQSDVESALNAATKIGDDALQRAATGTIRPENFTHGTSAQRVRWFNTGLQSGSIQRCDTFNTRDL